MTRRRRQRNERLEECMRAGFHARGVHVAMRAAMLAIDESRLGCEIELGEQRINGGTSEGDACSHETS